jgi:hypothetical protein
VAGGDLAVLTYADGSRYLGVSVIELRDGKVAKEIDYFAQPFQAPSDGPVGRADVTAR